MRLMKPVSAVKKATIGAFEPFEELGNQVAKPIGQEMANQLFGFFGESGALSSRPHSIAQEDLSRARQEKHIEDISQEDEEKSAQQRQRVQEVIQKYQAHDQKIESEQGALHQQVSEMQEEVVKLAKAAGVDTKIHIESRPKKLGILDLKRLTAIIKTLRLKAESAQSASEMVSQRQNAKRATGMMAWVSGKQMKIHEQGTMQLQG